MVNPTTKAKAVKERDGTEKTTDTIFDERQISFLEDYLVQSDEKKPRRHRNFSG